MKATIKTGGKQYNVSPGDILDIEKLDAKVGDTVSLNAICVIDGDKVEADPSKSSKTAVKAKVLEQHKGDKQIVFKFKRRKNYKVKRGHRQQLTKIQIVEIGGVKASAKPAAKKTESKETTTKKPAEKSKTTNKTTKKPAAKKAAEKETTAAKPAEKKADDKK